MKSNLIPYMLILLFMGISVWLSVKTKGLNNLVNTTQKDLLSSVKESNLIKHHLDNLQKAFSINFRMNPEPLLAELLPNKSHSKNLVLLHLKPNACTPCNMTSVEFLLDHFAVSKDFLILSHTSNQYFLSQLEMNGNDNNIIVWTEEKLYNYPNDGYDAELLFLDSAKFVVGRIPLDLLDEFIFNSILN